MIEGVRNDGGTAQTAGAEEDGLSPEEDDAISAAFDDAIGHALAQYVLGWGGQGQISVMNFLLEDSQKEFSING